MSLSISIIPKGFEEARKALLGIKDAYPKVISESINYGLRAGSTLAAKLVTKRYNIRSADIKEKGLDVNKANYHNLNGKLTARGPMLPVSLFSPKVSRPKKLGGRQLVKAAVIRGRTKVIRGAFSISGNRIKERRQPERYPIYPVMTIGIPHMVGHLGIAKQVENTINKKIDERLTHRVNYLLSKGGAK